MAGNNRHLLVCNCEKTMAFDAAAIGREAGFETVTSHVNLCRRETAAFEEALASRKGLCVACTQESPLFSEIAAEAGAGEPVFANIRENAGWTTDRAAIEPKMAAILAASTISGTSRLRTVASDGLCLLIGSGQQAFDVAAMLNRTLSVTLLLERDAGDIVLPSVLDFPVFAGSVTQANGSLGGFEVTVDGYAALRVSSRQAPSFGVPRNGAKSQCSVIFDMSGGVPLFAREHGRDGYFRADPGDPAAVMKAALEASWYSGEFEKPIYVTYDAEICAHERSKKTGCTKCLDNCPAGAISPDGDGVAIDAGICGGCGNCAAHCPTGAVSYDYPSRDISIRRVQTLASVFLKAGGKEPVLFVHDAAHGTPLVGAIARNGRGLPANVIPFEVHSTSGMGHDFMIAALAAGFRRIIIAADPRKQGEHESLYEEIALTDSFLTALGQGDGRIAVAFEADPDAVESLIWSPEKRPEISRAAFTPVGGKREVARAAIGLLLDAASEVPESIALPASAPYGRINVDTAACTLCLACVSACPADALRDNPDKPQLRFVESACVQCGICKATCPEKAITLEPRYSTLPQAMQPVTLNEDEPAECTRCGTPFASRKMLERVAGQLGGKHWMFQDDKRVALIHMCDSCRIEVLSEGGADPFAIASRPRTRTTDDYLNGEDDEGLTADDFLS